MDGIPRISSGERSSGMYKSIIYPIIGFRRSVA